jgi:hypothetical protein
MRRHGTIDAFALQRQHRHAFNSWGCLRKCSSSPDVSCSFVTNASYIAVCFMSAKARIGLNLAEHASGCLVQSVSDGAGTVQAASIRLSAPDVFRSLWFQAANLVMLPPPVFVGTPLRPNDVILRVNGADARDFKNIFAQGDISMTPAHCAAASPHIISLLQLRHAFQPARAVCWQDA